MSSRASSQAKWIYRQRQSELKRIVVQAEGEDGGKAKRVRKRK